jgi:hypothetical protein
MSTTTATLPGTLDTVGVRRPAKPVRSLGTLIKRRLSLTVRTPRSSRWSSRPLWPTRSIVDQARRRT